VSNNLGTYLNDHLAGARFAIDMLERLRDTAADAEFAQFTGEVLHEIEEDEAVLQRLADDVSGKSSTIKEATAWLAEKASRLKLRLGSNDELAVFEALEALSLGVLGKLKLWRVLSEIAEQHESLQGIAYEQLIARAASQHDRLEARRLLTGSEALSK
jgi:hypothetical protein